jgi:hypothetical protein
MRQNRIEVGVLTMLAGLLVAGGCASTEITDTWVDPAAKGAGLSRVAVICLAQDEGLRRMAEDEVAKQSKTTKLIPSYQLLDGIDLHDREAVKGRLRSSGVDGALLMRLAGVSEKLVSAGGAYDRFDPYYDWAYGGAYAPRTETTVRMVSSLYSLKGDKLIWSGASKTFDPTSARQVVNDVSAQVAKALQKDRLIL